ncbi:hypothetical protein BJ944DRAFT_45603 [Cunninghamella echinulata]|nr:hypothetical protein BJ944DRAFT_45603 [Cunninghamella echinulata]
MYSPINEMHPFETTANPNTSESTFTPAMEMQHPSMDYVRRFSYADLLSNHSEASLSDYEQQTPSPSNDYEEYIFHQQPHPLDEQKRRMSMIEANTTTCYTSPILPLTYLNPNPLFSAHPTMYYSPPNNNASLSPSHYSPPPPQQQRSMSYSAGDMLSSMVPTHLFDYQHGHPLSSPSINPAMDSLSPHHHHHDLMDPLQQRDRLDSISSVHSSPIPGTLNTAISSTAGASMNTNNNAKVTKNGKVKQCRSRGRRVSSNPTNCTKMFTCKHDDCGKVFKRSEHLKRHIRSIHTLEKPFECPYHSCSKRFSRSDNLNQHIRIHRHTNKDKSNNNSNNASSNPSSRQANSFNMPYV